MYHSFLIHSSADGRLGKSMTVFNKIKFMLALWPTSSAAQYLSKRNEKCYSQKAMYKNIHSIFVPIL